MGKTKDDKIQIPISSEKKKLLETRTEELGFSSVPEIMRFLINRLINKSIKIDISSEYIETLDEGTEREVLEGITDIKMGRSIKIDPEKEDFYEKILDYLKKEEK